MATAEFIGVVRGYSEGDDGLVHLSIDEATHSEEAEYIVKEMQRTFNPGSGNHGFGSRDVQCKIRPGFASYKFALTPDEAKSIHHGTHVRVRVDMYNVRKVIYHNRRWAPIPELRYNLLSIRPESDNRMPADVVQQSTQSQPKGGKDNK